MNKIHTVCISFVGKEGRKAAEAWLAALEAGHDGADAVLHPAVLADELDIDEVGYSLEEFEDEKQEALPGIGNLELLESEKK
jgi:hypothetical protein